jgi:hypothetical protein
MFVTICFCHTQPSIDMGKDLVTRCRQDGNHLASFGSKCVRKSHNDIDITLNIVIIAKKYKHFRVKQIQDQ